MNVNSESLDQTAWKSKLIWDFTVHIFRRYLFAWHGLNLIFMLPFPKILSGLETA